MFSIARFATLPSTNANQQEGGIFDSLRRNFLAAIQLTIFEEEVTPSNILEAYTFSFEYAGSVRNHTRRLAGLQLKGSTGEPITVRDAKYGVQMMVRRLVQLSTILPQLPGE